MSKMIRHRGPDWNGIHCDKNCVIAHERLAIVGVSSGAQPIRNQESTLFLSVNGEIYNYLSIKEQLIESNPEYEDEFVSDSDCEPIMFLYKKYGPHFMTKCQINGMYAFVIYDNVSDTYVVARDPIGIIPLYIGYGKDGSVWFSSELKALQEHCDHFESFPPGCYKIGKSLDSTFSSDMVRFYQSPWFAEPTFTPSIKYDPAEFRRQLTSSVRRHLMAEVPYGVLLSGGLDSSIVASIAAREYKSLGNVDTMRSYCIGLKGSPDLAAAEKVAEFIGSRHFSFEFTVQEGLDALKDVIYHLETFDRTTIRASTPMFLMSRKIKATGVKMVLSGEGADEIFGGYLYFHKAPNASELHDETVRKVKDLHKFDCLRANKSTMAWGLEARVPFLDREFLEYSMALEPESKMCGNRIEKWIIRNAFDDQENPYLPESVLWRQKEQFSDGVGYSWIDMLKMEAEKKVTDLQMKHADSRFPQSSPQTKEDYMYREIFQTLFPSPSAVKSVPFGKSIACSTEKALEWDQSFQNAADPSGRSVAGVHVDAYA
jgi:asparagine synthase (glutamine-hydrolysing)